MNMANSCTEQAKPTTYEAMNANGRESMKDAATASSRRTATVAMEMIAGRFFMMCVVKGVELLHLPMRILPPKRIIGVFE
jgi:hypothetical protein